MSDEQINIAIAEACGWTWIEEDYTYYGFTCEIPMKRKRWTPPNGGKPTLDIPDYCNDLNAMHEAEKVLLSGYWLRYCECLTYLLGKSVYASVHARARDRAEAFLRTLGKWEETK